MSNSDLNRQLAERIVNRLAKHGLLKGFDTHEQLADYLGSCYSLTEAELKGKPEEFGTSANRRASAFR